MYEQYLDRAELEPFPQNVFPERFVQRVVPHEPLKGFEMARFSIAQWTREPMILLFDPSAVVERRGQTLNNDFTQTIAHSHSWGGYLHFYTENMFSEDRCGSSIPPAFIDEYGLADAMRAGCEEVSSTVQGISSRVHVEVTDAGWPMHWTAEPGEHVYEALDSLDPDGDPVTFHRSCARLRKTIGELPLPWEQLVDVNLRFSRAGQKATEKSRLPIDVTDGKTVAFPPRTGHYRLYPDGMPQRVEDENPRGGKLRVEAA